MNSFSYPDSDGFGGFGPFLSGLSIITLAIYFITSSDSGSLVVDILASNGATQHHWIQRVFWAITEGGKLHKVELFLGLIDLCKYYYFLTRSISFIPLIF